MYLTANNSGTVFVATDWRMAQSREAIDSNINNKIYEGSKNLRILPRVIVGRGEINRPCNLAYTEPLMARQLFNVEYYPVLLLSVVLIGIQWNLYIVHRSMIFFFLISLVIEKSRWTDSSTIMISFKFSNVKRSVAMDASLSFIHEIFCLRLIRVN